MIMKQVTIHSNREVTPWMTALEYSPLVQIKLYGFLGGDEALLGKVNMGESLLLLTPHGDPDDVIFAQRALLLAMNPLSPKTSGLVGADTKTIKEAIGRNRWLSVDELFNGFDVLPFSAKRYT